MVTVILTNSLNEPCLSFQWVTVQVPSQYLLSLAVQERRERLIHRWFESDLLTFQHKIYLLIECCRFGWDRMLLEIDSREAFGLWGSDGNPLAEEDRIRTGTRDLLNLYLWSKKDGIRGILWYFRSCTESLFDLYPEEISRIYLDILDREEKRTFYDLLLRRIDEERTKIFCLALFRRTQGHREALKDYISRYPNSSILTELVQYREENTIDLLVMAIEILGESSLLKDYAKAKRYVQHSGGENSKKLLEAIDLLPLPLWKRVLYHSAVFTGMDKEVFW